MAGCGCGAAGRAKGVGGGGRHRVLRQFGYKSLTGAAGWVVWAGLGGWRRRGDVCVLALFVFLHDRSHDMPCICAKYLIFTVISCSSLFLSLTMRFFLLPHQDRVPYGLGDQVSPVPVEILGPSRRSKVPVRAIKTTVPFGPSWSMAQKMRPARGEWPGSPKGFTANEEELGKICTRSHKASAGHTRECSRSG